MDKFITFYEKDRVETISIKHIIKFEISNQSYGINITFYIFNDKIIKNKKGSFDIKKVYGKIKSFISSKSINFLDLDKILKETNNITKKKDFSKENQNLQRSTYKKKPDTTKYADYLFV